MIHKLNQRGRRGGVLVMFALAMVVIIGGSGLAVDIGRMYVNRTEAQSYVDSLALARAAEMIGARTVNNADIWKQYDFNNQSFAGATVIVDYSAGPGFAGGTVTSSPGAGSLYVRARATVNVPLVLLPVILGQNIGTVSAVAVAGLERLTSTGEGTFPYAVRSAGTGFLVGQEYTFRWGNNPGKDLEDAWGYVDRWASETVAPQQRLDHTATILRGQGALVRAALGVGANPPNVNRWCGGHATSQYVGSLIGDPATFNGVVSGDLFAWTGSFFQGGTNDIVAAMAYGYQTVTIAEQDEIAVATGVRQATVNELEWIIEQDTDQSGNIPAAYAGNDMRLIYTPVVHGIATAYLRPGSGATATVESFEAFLLMVPSSSYGNPQSNWCAVYYGATEFGTGTPVNQGSGIWVLRLVS